jgi:hypothetical protein
MPGAMYLVSRLLRHDLHQDICASTTTPEEDLTTARAKADMN